MHDIDRPLRTIVLRPEPGVAAVWSAWGGLLVAAGLWFVADAPTAPLSWIVLAIFAVLALVFLAQLAWPPSFELRLTQDSFEARTLWLRHHVSWDDVHLARVRTVFGDPVLELHVRERAGDDGDPSSLRTTIVPLPVGADVQALHRFLALRLGTPGLVGPQRLQPLEP